MFKIINKNQILINRGDIGIIDLTIPISKEEDYEFEQGDVITFAVYNTNSYQKDPIIYKEVIVENDGQTVVTIELEPEDTKVGPVINMPAQYWYEIQLNKEQTILGFDDKGPKMFILFPEGSDFN
jgi:hypothetical protein